MKKFFDVVVVGLFLGGMVTLVASSVFEFDVLGRRSNTLSPEHVACYSHGVAIYEGDTTGEVLNGPRGEKVFKDVDTGRSVIVDNASCVITIPLSGPNAPTAVQTPTPEKDRPKPIPNDQTAPPATDDDKGVI